MDLSEKVIVITGASSGLGKALAARFAHDKARLILLSRSAQKLQDISWFIAQEGGSCSCFSCNVTDLAQVKNAITYVVEAYGAIHVLINCASIWQEGSTESHPDEKVREMFEVNSLGVISMTREVLPHMKRAGYGQILNIVSSAGLEVLEKAPVYTATKFAVRGFTESLKKEVQNCGVRVMGLYPGGLDADLFTTQPFETTGTHTRTIKDAIADIAFFMITQPDEIVIDRIHAQRTASQS